ncbi:MAG: conserved hypothetical protein [Methanobrevibacter sp. CfCl-M3]
MKIFSYLKLATLIMLIAIVAIVAIAAVAWISVSNAGVIGGSTDVYYGQTDAIIPITDPLGNPIVDGYYEVSIDGEVSSNLGYAFNGTCYFNLPVEKTYEDHMLTINTNSYTLVWDTHPIKWPTKIDIIGDSQISRGSNHVILGGLYRPLDPGTEMSNRQVELVCQGFTVQGITDSVSQCWFDLSNVTVNNTLACIKYRGDEYNKECLSQTFTLSFIDVQPQPKPEPTPIPDNDINTTNTTNNTNNSTVDILKPLENNLEDIGESLPVTGIPVIVGLLACIASILIIKRK